MMQEEWGSEESGWYRLGRRLRSDGAGDLFETTHPRLSTPCAIKIISPELTGQLDPRRAFASDLQALAPLGHPNIQQVLHVGDEGEGAFVVTERLEGRLLAERLEEQGTVRLHQALPIIRGAAAALQAAHAVGVVHGELNPRTIFIARMEGYDQGVVKVLDFGICRLRPADAAASLPADTIRYLAPEQAAGRSEEIDGRSDQYALALIAYRMLSGQDAFPGDSGLTVLYQIVHEKPLLDGLGEGGPEVEAVLRRALSHDRRDRFDSVVMFARALESAAGYATGTSPVLPRVTPPPSPALTSVPAMAPVPPPASVTRAPELISASRVEEDPYLQHPFFTSDDPRPRRRVVLVRRRHSRAGGLLLLVFGAAAAWAVGAWAMGWRPPLPWQHSPLWRQLHLPEVPAVAPGR
jgi:serine/threonine protein kinase